MDAARAHQLATSFRYAADNAPPASQPALWTEGFCDGLRFGAVLLDLAADDRLTMDSLSEAVGSMFERRS